MIFKGDLKREVTFDHGCGPDWIEISAFEEEIQDVPDFCEEKEKFYR
jgi:hypothetical protein